MNIQELKEAFTKLELSYAPVAVKYHYAKPEGVERTDEILSFCQFIKKARRIMKE